MPPYGTTLRNVRIADELWQAAQRYADQHGTTVSDLLREHLQQLTEGES